MKETGRCVLETGWFAFRFAFGVRASPAPGKVSGVAPTPAWHGGGLVSFAAGDFESPLR